MNAEQMISMGYMKDGDLWISPTSGEVLSFEQARREALTKEIVATLDDGAPTNGSHW